MPLKIEKFRGVGRKTVIKMHELGVYNGYDLYGLSELDLIHYFGKMGHFSMSRSEELTTERLSGKENANPLELNGLLTCRLFQMKK